MLAHSNINQALDKISRYRGQAGWRRFFQHVDKLISIENLIDYNKELKKNTSLFERDLKMRLNRFSIVVSKMTNELPQNSTASKAVIVIFAEFNEGLKQYL